MSGAPAGVWSQTEDVDATGGGLGKVCAQSECVNRGNEDAWRSGDGRVEERAERVNGVRFVCSSSRALVSPARRHAPARPSQSDPLVCNRVWRT